MPESVEQDNRRGNPCGLCTRYHGAGPCPPAQSRPERIREALENVLGGGDD